MANLQNLYDNIPNLRNGNADNFQMVHIAAGIPEAYRALPIGGFAIPRTDIVLAIAVEGAIYAAGLEGGDIDAAQARKLGLSLAATRIGAQQAWSLTNDNYIAAQRHAETYYTDRYVPGDIVSDLNGVLPHLETRQHFQAIMNDTNLTDEVTLANLLRIGMAAPVTCGVILVKSDLMHHYVDPHQGIFRVVLRQVLGQGSPMPYDLTPDDFEDVVAHKGPHPIQTNLMVNWARSDKVMIRLRAAELASAAVRMPALFPAQASAAAVGALVTKASQVAANANVAVDAQPVVDAIAQVNGNAFDSAAGRAQSAVQMTALVEHFSVDLARCIGIVRAVVENAGIRAPPLLQSWALRRIANDNPAEVAEGVNQMRAFYRAMRERARRGIIPGMALFGAQRPDDTEALPADETIAQILAAVVGNNNNNRQGN